MLHNRTDCNDGGRGDLWRLVDPSTKTLSVQIEGGLGGTVTSRPGGISCEGDCVQDFEPGTRVTLRAEPSFARVHVRGLERGVLRGHRAVHGTDDEEPYGHGALLALGSGSGLPDIFGRG